MVIGSVTLGRRASLPVKGSSEKTQSVFVPGDGSAPRARTRGPDDDLVTYELKNVIRSEFEDLRDFLTGAGGANGRANTFTLTDDWGNSWTVNWWDKRLAWTEGFGRLYALTLTFRIVGGW